MYLFIDTISSPAVYVLFDSDRMMQSHEFLELKGRESEYFLLSLRGFLDKNTQKISDLEGVVVVNGPGSFTAMRIITLTINALSFVHGIKLYSIDYFALGKYFGWTYPIVIRANRGEYLIQKDSNIPPELVAITDMKSGSYFGIGDMNDFTNGNISIQSKTDYHKFCRNFQMINPTQRIDPFYIKKPNII